MAKIKLNLAKNQIYIDPFKMSQTIVFQQISFKLKKTNPEIAQKRVKNGVILSFKM